MIFIFGLFSYEEIQKAFMFYSVNEKKIITDIKLKIDEFKKAPTRVEVRNYLKSSDHRYQKIVKIIKKIKTPLNPNSPVYLEINLFTDEEDKDAPLVAQLMWFDIKTRNLILEENLNLE